MYIISAVIEKEQARVALLDKHEYKLLLKKEGTLDALATLCSDVISEGGIKAADVDYIGVAADFSIAPKLEAKTGIKCIGATLTDARALGEAYEQSDANTLVMLKIDDTVECGIVIDKKLYTGANGQSGNVAHMVINYNRFECSCGNRGCFEAYASNSGFKRIVSEAGVSVATHKELFAMSTPESKLAQKNYVNYLATGITNIINLFQPRHLVFEGPFTEVGDALMEPLMDIILREQYTHSMPNKCDVRFASTEEDTALIGAALLGR